MNFKVRVFLQNAIKKQSEEWVHCKLKKCATVSNLHKYIQNYYDFKDKMIISITYNCGFTKNTDLLLTLNKKSIYIMIFKQV